MKTQNLKKIVNRKSIIAILLSISIATFASCSKDDDGTKTVEPQKNIVQTAESVDDLSTLVTAIKLTDLGPTLSNDGPFTVFAPINSAFAKLDPETLNNILGDPMMVKSLLLYHVVEGKVMSSQLSTGMVTTLYNNEKLNIEVKSNSVMINGTASVIQADIEVSNGVVHLIDEVLIPENFIASKPSILEIALSDENFSDLVSVLSRPSFSYLLDAISSSESDLTVFAPTNSAFDELLSAVGKSDISELSDELLMDVVKYHLVQGSFFSTDLSTGNVMTLLDGEYLNVDVSNGVMINDAKVTSADVEASNGVVHVVDKVLLPKFVTDALGTVGQMVMLDKDYSMLFSALRKAELFNAISTTENITLFAPNNDAFSAAGINSFDGLDNNALSQILLYHVIGAKVMSDMLPDNGIAETLSNNEKIYFGYLTNKVLINGLTTITATDIEMSNGVIHTIDRTLMPPAYDVVDIAAAFANMGDDSEFTVLVSLLVSDDYSDILNVLKTSENITVFAPTDAAFEEISSVIPTLSKEQIASVLKYHVLGSRVFSTDLTEGMNPNTLNGQSITINLSNGAQITDMSGGDKANIIEVNIHGKNGVIHVIDKVLLPSL